jgi:hypothetical protein
VQAATKNRGLDLFLRFVWIQTRDSQVTNDFRHDPHIASHRIADKQLTAPKMIQEGPEKQKQNGPYVHCDNTNLPS